MDYWWWVNILIIKISLKHFNFCYKLLKIYLFLEKKTPEGRQSISHCSISNGSKRTLTNYSWFRSPEWLKNTERLLNLFENNYQIPEIFRPFCSFGSAFGLHFPNANRQVILFIYFPCKVYGQFISFDPCR